MLQVWRFIMSHDTEWLVAIDPCGRTARLVGAFDHTNAEAVYEALATIPDPQPRVLIDLGAVTACSLALLTCLIDARSRYAALGADLAITNASAHVHHLLGQADDADQLPVVLA
jgi:anti-anti-sigma regulatory factor